MEIAIEVIGIISGAGLSWSFFQKAVEMWKLRHYSAALLWGLDSFLFFVVPVALVVFI